MAAPDSSSGGNGFRQKRERLVEHLKYSGILRSKAVEDAFLRVKRELFVEERMKDLSYADDALPIGHGQTISQPTTIAVMLELLDVKEGMRVLEVGSGCGYVCALLGEIAGSKGSVIGIELIKELAERSGENLKKQGTKNAEIIHGDCCECLDKEKVCSKGKGFDRILVSAACPYVPKILFDCLREKGRIVAPVGDRYTQIIEIMEKVKGERLKSQYPGGYFAFVPLVSKTFRW
jgi:protein-L-isoaspartate(D-aspartate) O-methyltransferase